MQMRRLSHILAVVALLCCVPGPSSRAADEAAELPADLKAALDASAKAEAELKAGNKAEATARFGHAAILLERASRVPANAARAPAALRAAMFLWQRAGESELAMVVGEELVSRHPDAEASQKGVAFLAYLTATAKDYAASERWAVEYLKRWPQGADRCVALQNVCDAQTELKKLDEVARRCLEFNRDTSCTKVHPNLKVQLLYMAADQLKGAARNADRRELLQEIVGVKGVTGEVSMLLRKDTVMPPTSYVQYAKQELAELGGRQAKPLENAPLKQATTVMGALEGAWPTNDRWIAVLQGNVILANGWEEEARTRLQAKMLMESERFRHATEVLARKKEALLGHRAYVRLGISPPPYDLNRGAFVYWGPRSSQDWGWETNEYVVEGTVNWVSLPPVTGSKDGANSARCFHNSLTIRAKAEEALKIEKAGFVFVYLVYRVEPLGMAKRRMEAASGTCAGKDAVVLQGVPLQVVVANGDGEVLLVNSVATK